MQKRLFALVAALSVCLMLFGCSAKPDQQDPVTTTTLPPQQEKALLPKDGYYVLKDQEVDSACYLQLQNMEGTLYMMNLPMAVSLRDEMLHMEDQEAVEYTYKNDKLTFSINKTKLTLQYAGEVLPEKYMPVMPPAGSYGVSSISKNGDLSIFGTAETEDRLTITQEGTGIFSFGDQQYEIQFSDYTLLVDGEPCGFAYYPETGDTPILMLLWMNEDADSIALRPITEE